MSGGEKRLWRALVAAVRAGKSGDEFLKAVSGDLRGADAGLFNCVVDVLREAVSVHDAGGDGGEFASTLWNEDAGVSHGHEDRPPDCGGQSQAEHDAALRDIGECGEWRTRLISGKR